MVRLPSASKQKDCNKKKIETEQTHADFQAAVYGSQRQPVGRS